MAIFRKKAGTTDQVVQEGHLLEGARAPAIVPKLDGALAIVAALEAEAADLALQAVERKPGAAEKLTAHRAKITAAKTAVDELRAALRLAGRLDRIAAAEEVANIRADQFATFKQHMSARRKAMATVLEAAAAMAKAYGDYILATEQARASLPDGTILSEIHVGRNGVCGRSLGPLDRLIAAELWRLAPSRGENTNSTIALPFAAPLTEAERFKPSLIPPALTEFEAADAVNIAEIEQQLEHLKTADRAAIDSLEAA